MKKLLLPAALLTALLAAAAIFGALVRAPAGTGVPQGMLVRIDSQASEADAQGGTGRVNYTCSIPSDHPGGQLFVYIQSYWNDFEVSCGGQTILTHSIGMRDGYSHLVALGKTEPQQEVVVSFEPGSSAAGAVRHGSILYIGDQNGIYSKILRDNIYALLYLLLTLLLSAAIVCMVHALRGTMPKSRCSTLLALACFILITGVWVLTDSQLLLLVTTRTAVITLVSFLSFMLMPVFMLYVTERMVDMDKRVCGTLKVLYTLILDLYAANYILSISSGMALLVAEHVLSLFTIVYILARGIRQLRRVKSAKLSRIICGYAVFCAGCITALALFYTRPFSGYSQVYALGTASFVFFLFDAACREVYEQLEENVDLSLRAKLAYIDTLTDTGNRAAFHDKQVQDKGRTGTIAYIMADINNLKVTNDTFGHRAGDEIIIRAADCLKRAVGTAGSCYRIGGDEFVVCLYGLPRQRLPEYIAAFYREVESANALSEHSLSVACGYAWTDDPLRDLDSLFGEADAAMYREKQKVKQPR